MLLTTRLRMKYGLAIFLRFNISSFLVPPVMPWSLKNKGNKLGARSHKCIFLGYLDTTKGYKLYDEVNKKFLFSRDVIFLECSKDELTIEQQLDHLDRFTYGKQYIEANYEIPNIEGGILILDPSLESTPLVPIQRFLIQQ